jgi:hypothetical protein
MDENEQKDKDFIEGLLGSEPKPQAEDKYVEYVRFAMEQVMKSKDGRTVLLYLMNKAGIMSPSFHPDNQYQTAYNEGRREDGIELRKEIEAIDHNCMILMQQEHIAFQLDNEGETK